MANNDRCVPSEAIEWSDATPLVKVLNSWKEYPVSAFHSEFILTMRMRHDAMEKDSTITFKNGEKKEIKKEDMRIHIVFHRPINTKHGSKVFLYA